MIDCVIMKCKEESENLAVIVGCKHVIEPCFYFVIKAIKSTINHQTDKSEWGIFYLLLFVNNLQKSNKNILKS